MRSRERLEEGLMNELEEMRRRRLFEKIYLSLLEVHVDSYQVMVVVVVKDALLSSPV